MVINEAIILVKININLKLDVLTFYPDYIQEKDDDSRHVRSHCLGEKSWSKFIM